MCSLIGWVELLLGVKEVQRLSLSPQVYDYRRLLNDYDYF